MHLHLQSIKSDAPLKQSIQSDFSVLLQQIGLSQDDIATTIKKFFDLLDEDITQSLLEEKFREFIFAKSIDNKSFKDAFHTLQIKRSERIYSEIVDFIQTKNKVLDFGCGNGLVGQLLSDKNNIQVEGCDIVVYSGPDITIPIHKFGGYHLDVVDGYFESGYANSVLHHDVEPDKVIGEITRVVSNKFILIEDTLQGKNEKETDLHSKRLFINDYIYNRLLIDSDIPVPAKYRTSSEWIEAFTSFGWKLSKQDELGWSKILPAVFRERFIFERE